MFTSLSIGDKYYVRESLFKKVMVEETLPPN